ncbi:unnamed protein product (mitochondrion) [Plasmodiophora brassicae]|uniref:Large ribosomal subunit protein mL40 n=1 Tax=Plasmodiophora brassicae TaxID=37360 RepID=A0A0G4INA7_PLABS|nr:hypothetical protein PBRA_005325 [Plasmodiophora brassicae]SPQ95383.1 unnamed protein product [Plasmodiophora brassicae]
MLVGIAARRWSIARHGMQWRSLKIPVKRMDSTEDELEEERKRTEQKKSKMKGKKDPKKERESPGQDDQVVAQCIEWYDQKGAADDRTQEELDRHKELAKEYSRQCGARDRRIKAYLTERIRLRAEAIAALPTDALRKAAEILNDDDQMPLCIPNPKWHPPLKGYKPGMYSMK